MRGREAFAAALRPALGQVHIEGRSEIKEIHVAENYAFCWSQLSLTVTSVSGRACPTARWSDVSLSQRARWTLGSLSRCEHAHGGINVKLSKTGTDSRKVIRIVARQRMAGDERSSSRMASVQQTEERLHVSDAPEEARGQCQPSSYRTFFGCEPVMKSVMIHADSSG
jgi:hypothetical protein